MLLLVEGRFTLISISYLHALKQFVILMLVSNVLIGWYSTRGLGKALAREFLLSGDRVVIASRRWCLDFDNWLFINLSECMVPGG